MSEQDLEQLKYPIGKLQLPNTIDLDQIRRWIDNLSQFPGKLALEVKGMTDAQLDTSYRPGGWTARQVVHHLADSHMNSYIRFKWAITEDNPTIKGYNENIWSAMQDARQAPIDCSVDFISGLHARWVFMLMGMSESDFQRTFFHPEFDRTMRLDRMVGLYSWHGDHHLGHIRNVKNPG
jgi:hypothetical protein